MGWFIVTILVPVLAPNAFLLVLRAVHLPPATARLLNALAPIRDGQLCWAAIAFCASGLYELAESGCEPAHLSAGLRGWTQGGLIILLAASSIIAASGAAFPAQQREPSSGNLPWYLRYKAFAMSLFLTSLAGLAYTVVHFS